MIVNNSFGDFIGLLALKNKDMKERTNYFSAGLFIGLVIIGGIFTFYQPTPKVEQSEKMKECINVGGQFSISDWSWKDDGSDYRMTCKIPEHNLWQYEL